MANKQRPRRSILFAFFAAEEKGLLGSTYFVDHPPVPLENLILEIQLDMVGREEEGSRPGATARGDGGGGTAGADKAGTGSEGRTSALGGDAIQTVGTLRHSDELDPWVRAIVQRIGVKLDHGDENFYPMSDQYCFGNRDIPVVFFFCGMHSDYHKPTDTVDKIDFAKLAAVTRISFALAFEVADRERRLVRNRV